MPKKVMTDDQRLQAMYERGRTKGRVEAAASMLTQQEHEDLCRDALVRERARIKAGVEGLPDIDPLDDGTRWYLDRAAVLRIVEGETP